MSTDSPRILRKLRLYQTKARFYLVGRTQDKQRYRVAKFSRQADVELQAVDDKILYTEVQCSRLLSSINDGNKLHGGLTPVLEADALIGCFRFLEGYYLLFVTQKKLEGSMCGTDKIYSVADIRLVSLRAPNEQMSKDEKRYRKVLSCVELTKNFFFSYSWPLWRTVQANLSCEVGDDAWQSMFVWNNYLTRAMRGLIDPRLWVMPLIHGHWQQRTLAISSQTLTITLIARRSKYFAGTRYRKRGINDQGYVANDVETEQVVSAGYDWRTGFPIVSSIVQMRGSIPLFWIQDNTQRKLKPDIFLQRFDPLFEATRLHFQDLRARYGNPIVVLNLVKNFEKRPREQLLRTEYGNAISHINDQRGEEEKIIYMPWDFNYWAKRRGSQLLTHIAPVIKQSLQHTSLFVCAPAAAAAAGEASSEASHRADEVRFQRGVVRTNCIDCLDRTNVAQFALGLHALGLQLQALGLSDSPDLDTRSSIAGELMNLYEQMGNVLARQYGGSEAHSTIFKRERGDWEYATAIGDKLTTLRRYYSNNYTDAEKQDALNLLLGNFVPVSGQPAIWELDSDYYLHSDLEACGDSRQAITSPTIASGHPAGEGVRNIAALLAAAQLGRRLPDISPRSLGGIPLSPSERPVSKGEEGGDAPENCRADSQGGASPASEGPSLAVAREGTVLELSQPSSHQRLPGKYGGTESGSCGNTDRQAIAVEPDRLPKMPPGETRGQVLQGVHRLQETANRNKRPKLESFDWKLGRPPNAILQVKLDTSSAGASTFLPHWLASPLGITRSLVPSTELSSTLGVPGGPSLDLAALPPLRRPPSLDTALQNPLQGRAGLVSRPSFERRSADSSRTGLRPYGRPITRSASETWDKWNRSVAQNIQAALSESITQPVGVSVASPPNQYPAFAGEDTESLGEGRLAVRTGAVSLAPASSIELVESLLSKPLQISQPFEAEHQEQLQADSLGLSHGLYAWWAGKICPGAAWESEEDAARATYSRYLRRAEKLVDGGIQASDATAEYDRLCDFSPLHTFFPEAAPDDARLRRCGVAEMTAWGEAAIRRLAAVQSAAV